MEGQQKDEGEALCPLPPTRHPRCQATLEPISTEWQQEELEVSWGEGQFFSMEYKERKKPTRL